MAKKNGNRNISVLIIVGIVLLLVGGFFMMKMNEQKRLSAIDSFEKCQEAGYPIMESYPPQCRVNGQTFTQDIGNELEYRDEILISNPRPNQKIKSPVTITGKARGNWFFEASLSAEIVDSDNKHLSDIILTAKGEWMTEDFVEFKGTFEFEKPESNKGKVVIKNANPSGMEENQKTLIIPVEFE